MLPDVARAALGSALLGYARMCILHEFGGVDAIVPRMPRFEAPGATFVTITRPDGTVRGCTGSVEARRPLWQDVRANAVAAAFLDPRSEPLRKRELHADEIEVALLSPLERMTFDSEEDAIAKLRPGIDGLVLSWGPIRSVVLPQAWERIPDPRDFLAYLKMRARLAPTFWAHDIELRRFTVERWREAHGQERAEARRARARASHGSVHIA